MLNYYKDCCFINLLSVNDFIEKSYKEFDELLYIECSKEEIENLSAEYESRNKVFISGIDKGISREDLLFPGLEMSNDVNIEKMKLLSNFIEDVGFSLKDDYSCYYTFSNFLNSDEYPLLFNVTTSFESFLKNNLNNLNEDMINELKNNPELRYFENDCFIFIPDYGKFIDNDVFHSIPNFIYKEDGFAIRFRKGIGRSSYCNFEKSLDEFDKMLYNCLISTIDE